MQHNNTLAATDFVEIEGEIEMTPPDMYAAYLIEWAVERRASDLFVSDHENCVVVAVRRMGKVEVVRRLARSYGHRLQGHLRVLSGGDAGEMIRPSEGRGVVRTPNGSNVDLRLSCIPTLFGQDVAIRLFDPVRGARHLPDLGLDPDELTQLIELLERPAGLILVAGPVASGKSSTLYAAIDHLNDGTRKIHALEDPIEHSLSGVMQSQVNLRAGLDFADLLAVVLRHSPDVIMIGEVRDARTAETAVRAGASGQLVLATIHGKTAVQAIDSMLQYKANPKFLASSLIGIINQRLIRKLCTDCRQMVTLEESIEVPERLRARLGNVTPAIYRAVGCEKCFGDGFTSLTCLPEIMPVSRAISESIANGDAAIHLETLAREEGMLTLAEAAAIRVLRGDTTAFEVNRIVSDPFLASLTARSVII
jgi:type II secretory ATPase GspE/PulE/Tfp pilus assembly ATPase PilB-like protein